MALTRAAALLLLCSLAASELETETESEPKRDFDKKNPIDEAQHFLDPTWMQRLHPNDIGSGLKMHTLEKGDEKSFPERGDLVTVEFQGFLDKSGQRFQFHRGFSKPYTFMIGKGLVMKGWDEGVSKMSLGQRALVHVPSDLAYGPFRSGSGRVPPNSDLTFDIKVLGIKKGFKQLGMGFDGKMSPEEEEKKEEKEDNHETRQGKRDAKNLKTQGKDYLKLAKKALQGAKKDEEDAGKVAQETNHGFANLLKKEMQLHPEWKQKLKEETGETDPIKAAKHMLVKAADPPKIDQRELIKAAHARNSELHQQQKSAVEQKSWSEKRSGIKAEDTPLKPKTEGLREKIEQNYEKLFPQV